MQESGYLEENVGWGWGVTHRASRALFVFSRVITIKCGFILFYSFIKPLGVLVYVCVTFLNLKEGDTE